jgi:nitrite reductase (NO-forming)
MKLVCQLICVVVLPLLVACSATSASRPATASGAASPSPQPLTVTAMDTMRFDPSTLTARAGQPIQVTLKNSGQLAHDFDITDGVAQPVKITAQAGQTATATFTIDKPGTYTFFCSQPGHEQAGMKGTLTVQ